MTDLGNPNLDIQHQLIDFINAEGGLGTMRAKARNHGVTGLREVSVAVRGAEVLILVPYESGLSEQIGA